MSICTFLSVLENIPTIWKRAYVLLCLWYALNFGVSTILQYEFETPHAFIFWNALYLFEALCVLIILIFLYARFLFKFSIYIQVIGHIAGTTAYFFIMGSLSYYLQDYVEGYVYFDHWKEHLLGLLKWEGVDFHNQYVITLAVFYIIQYFYNVQKKEQEKSELTLKNREMQLSLLKSQINPHFLFNTLNSINTLVGSSKEQARKVITQLSDIFRYALDSHGDQMVKLLHEIDFIDNYMRIQQVRFGERLRFVKNVDFTCLGVSIPPMILQPLVENSVKYGIAPKDEGGTIVLTVKRTDEGTIYFEVKDDGLGSKAKKVMDSYTGSGVGLANTDQRLRSIFGQASALRIHASEMGYSVSFYIPAEETPKQSTHILNEELNKAV